jgi:hypothetical protein
MKAKTIPVPATEATILDGGRIKMCVVSLQLFDHVPALLQQGDHAARS